jgi:hypothetical protein
MGLVSSCALCRAGLQVPDSRLQDWTALLRLGLPALVPPRSHEVREGSRLEEEVPCPPCAPRHPTSLSRGARNLEPEAPSEAGGLGKTAQLEAREGRQEQSSGAWGVVLCA